MSGYLETSMIKALIFDMDGLMIDSERLYFQTEKEIAAQFGKKTKEETFGKMMGRNPLESMNIFKEDLDIPLPAEELLEMRTTIMREKLKSDLVPMPGLMKIIDSFSNKLKMAITTGAQKEFLDIVVDILGLRDKFQVLQPSDEIVKGKPHPEIYLVTCTKLQLKPGECVVLEDSFNGVLAAKKAGCYVIAVPSEYTKEHDFTPADFIAKNLFVAEKHINDLLGTP